MVETENKELKNPESFAKNNVCRRCGRKLKNPASIEVGFGVVCYQKFLQQTKLIPLFEMKPKGASK